MAKKLVQARVLVGFVLGAQSFQPNDLVEGATGIIKTYEKDNILDTNKDAVAFALTNGAEIKPIEGDDPADDEAAKAAAEVAAAEAATIAAFSAEEKSAFEKSGATLGEWQALPEDDRTALITAETQA